MPGLVPEFAGRLADAPPLWPSDFGVRLTSSVLVGLDTNGDFKASTDVTLFGPNLAQPTLINAFSGGAFRGAYTTPAIYLGGHNQSASTQFDGIEFNTDSPGTITGTYAVYGYSKAV